MKFIHTADLHLGAVTEARLPREKAELRRRELLLCFARIARLAEEEGAAVLIAGDLFDTATPSPALLAGFLDTVRHYAGVRFFCLPGNHDGGRFPAVELPENLVVFGQEWTSVSLGDTDVFGIAPDGEIPYDALLPDPDRKNVVLLHGGVRESGTGDAGEVVLSRLAGRGIDYLALGHYHSHRVGRLDARGVYAYSGTPEGRGMDEGGECGILIVDTEKSPPAPVFLRTAKRLVQVLTARIDSAELSHVAERIREVLSGVAHEDLVRVVLTGNLPLDSRRVNTAQLTEMLGGDYFYFEIKDKTGLSVRPEEYIGSLTLKGEFTRQVMAADLRDEERDRILRAGLAALRGEGDEI